MGYFGLSSGDSTFNEGAGYLLVMRFQNTQGSGIITQLELLLADTTPTGNVRLGVYADAGGVPGALLLDAGAVAVTNSWVIKSGLSLSVSANTNYWLAFVLSAANGVRYQSGGSYGDVQYLQTGYAPLPSPWPGGNGSQDPYVMRAYVAVPVVAGFTASPLIGEAPLTVAVMDTSTGAPTSWLWQWGDGTTSNLQNPPAHTYPNPGTYRIMLTVQGEGGPSFAYLDVTATVPGAVMAGFNVSPTIGPTPLTVTATDASANNPTSWLWDWGDGTTSSGRVPGSHTYTNPSTYRITLTVQGTGGPSAAYIDITATPPLGATIVEGLLLTPTFECIGVRCKFSGDTDDNARAILEYRPQGGVWKIADADMWEDRRATVRCRESANYPNPYVNEFRASIFGCRRATTYEVRVTVSDPQGVGGSPIMGTVTTWSHDEEYSNGAVKYVSPSGIGDGSSSSFPMSMSTAIATALPDEKYLLLPGNYGSRSFSRDGAAFQPITWEAFDPNNLPNFSGTIALDCNRNRFKNFYHPSGGTTIARNRAALFNVLEWVEHVNTGIVLLGDVNGLLVQRSYIHETALGALPPLGVEKSGIYRREGVPGSVVIRYNDFARCWDAVGGEANDSINAGWPNSDVYENWTTDDWDDGFELEGIGLNTRFWNNHTVTPPTAGFAYTEIVVGPYYAIHNIVDGQRNTSLDNCMMKQAVSNGRGYIYHNTGYRLKVGVNDRDDPAATNIIYLNNIFWGWKASLECGGNGSLFDYNCHRSEGSKLIIWDSRGVGEFYTSLAAFRVAHPDQEIHGIQADPLFVDAAKSDFRLQLASPCLDKGVVLPGINDAGSKWAFAGLTPDIGATERIEGAISPVALFEASPLSGTPPFTVAFVNLSSGDIDSFYWAFGDGTSSSLRTPSPHTYTTGGLFTVTLTAIGPGGSATYAVTINAGPGPVTYQLTIGVVGSGTVVPAPGTLPYPKGTRVDLLATPTPGWVFQGWTGSLVSPNPSESVVVDTDMSITAFFVPITYPVSVSTTIGGTTDPSPGVYQYNEGSEVVLTALPDGGNYFRGWQERGILISTANPYRFIVVQDRSLIAVFALVPLPPDEFAVSITSLGEGTTDPSAGTYTVLQGEMMNALAIPDVGWKLDYWQYDSQTSKANPLVLQVNSNLSVVAVFAEEVKPPSTVPTAVLVAGALVLATVAISRKKRR